MIEELVRESVVYCGSCGRLEDGMSRDGNVVEMSPAMVKRCKSRCLPGFVLCAVLAVYPGLQPAEAVTLTANENVGDGVLSGTGGPVTNEAGAVFNWADGNGDGTANDAVAADLNLNGKDLTRTGDGTGFTLNLNDGTSDGVITNGGSIKTAVSMTATTGPITISNAAGVYVSSIDTSQGQQYYSSGAIVLSNVGTVTASVVRTASGAGNIYHTGGITVQQYQGDFVVGYLRNDSTYVSTYSSGAITLTGPGTEAGVCSIGYIDKTASQPLNVTIRNYRSVTIGSSGIDARDTGTSSHYPGNVYIINIGSGGVVIGGSILASSASAQGGAFSQAGVIITNIAGSVQVGSIDLHGPNTGNTLWHNVTIGNVNVRAAGNVTLGNLTTYYGTSGSSTYNAGDITVVSSAGSVAVRSLDAHQEASHVNSYAGNATLTAYGDLSVTGSVINLYAPYDAARRGILSLTTSAGSGGSIYVNGRTNDVFDLSLMQYAKFSSDSGYIYLAGILTNFSTTASGGDGSLGNPYITTQTALRVPEGQILYYKYIAGVLNPALGGSVYRVAAASGAAGAGGWLIPERPGAPVIANVVATNLTSTSCDLVGNLTTGDAPVTVGCYWGTTAGWMTAGAWQNSSSLGTRSYGLVTNSITGLIPGQRYYFRFYATNSTGDVWSDPPMSFTTPWDSTRFKYRMKVSFTNYSRSETLTNFPALVVLGSGLPGFSYGQFASTNGYDLWFADETETSRLNHEVERWSTSGNSYVWVQVPAFTNNCCVWACWGNQADTNQQAYTTSGATWSDGFKGVYHFQPTNGIASLMDSSTNLYHGSNVSTTADSSGIIGYAESLNGIDQRFELATGNKYLVTNNTPITATVWIKPGFVTNAAIGSRLFGLARSAGSSGFLLAIGSSSREQAFYATTAGVVTYVTNTPAGLISAGAWHHTAIVFNGSQLSLMLNGSVVTNVAAGVTNAPSSFTARAGSDFGTPAGNYYSGLMDELQVSGVARSTNWIWAEYMNVASNSVFNLYGRIIPKFGGSVYMFQ